MRVPARAKLQVVLQTEADYVVRTWGAAVLRPYNDCQELEAAWKAAPKRRAPYVLGVGDERDPDVFAFVDEGDGDAFGGLGGVH
jgi:hypothetical protein